MKNWRGVALCILALAASFSSIAQELTSKSKKAVKLYKEAEQCFDKRDYTVFFGRIEEALSADSQFIEAYLLGMQGYIEQRKDSMAIAYGEKAFDINPKFYPSLAYVLGNICYKHRSYDKALQYYRFYAGSYPNQKSKVEGPIARILHAKELMDNPVAFTPKNMGDSVNTSWDDYWPSISGDGKTLVKTTNLPTTNSRAGFQEDFFIAQADSNGVWRKAKLLPGLINTGSNEGAQSLTADGRGMFFTTCGITCHIYYSTLTSKGWSEPVKLPAPVNSLASDKQPSISPDGKYLFFTSNRPGGYGGYDLYMAIRDDETGEWDEVLNLGDKINTSGNDVSPYVHFDGQSLYFSSDGHWGVGGLDLFLTRRNEKGEWSTPVNLGYPINTPNDEQGIAISPDARTTFIASDRILSKGLDLYSFELPNKVKPNPSSYIKGVVVDARTKKKLQAKVILGNLETGVDEFTTLSGPADGAFFTSLPANKSYALQVTKAGYLFYSESFMLDSTRTIQNPVERYVELQPIEVGSKTILKNVYFGFNAFVLEKESFVELDRLLSLLNSNPTLWIEISGHTDAVGSNTYNQQLSEKRALAVKTYLVEKGIASNRLKHVGYGATKPIADNSTEEGRTRNRRTEIVVLYK